MPSGKKLYFKSYPVAKSSLFYLDPTAETNNIVFSSLGEPTGVKSIVVQKNGKKSGGSESFDSSLNISFHREGGDTRVKRVSIPADATSEELNRIREKVHIYVQDPSNPFGNIAPAIVDADPGVSHYLRFYPGAGTAIFSDPEAQSENWVWASLGTPTEIKKVTVSSGNDNGNGNGTANKRRSKTSIGQFVLYGQDGNVRNRIPISADDSREEIAKKYHEIRDQIPALRDG